MICAVPTGFGSRFQHLSNAYTHLPGPTLKVFVTNRRKSSCRAGFQRITLASLPLDCAKRLLVICVVGSQVS